METASPDLPNDTNQYFPASGCHGIVRLASYQRAQERTVGLYLGFALKVSSDDHIARLDSCR